MKRIILAVGLVFAVAAFAVAAPQNLMTQGYYFTDVGGNDATYSITYSRDSSDNPQIEFRSTTSDTLDFTFTPSGLVLADSNYIAFGTAAADGNCQSDGTNIDCTVTTLMTIGDGGTTSYTSFSSTGVQTWLGGAQATLNDNVELNFGTSAGESTIASNATNTNWTITSGTVTIGDGGTTSYTSFSSTGVQTWLGGAQAIFNDNVELRFGTSGAESQIASNGTDTTWTVSSGDLVLGTDGLLTRLEGAVQLGAVSTFTDSDGTPNVTGNTYWNTNTTAFTITDFDGSGIEDGQLLFIVSKGAIVFDCTSSGLKCGSADLTSASGDLLVFVYDGTDWILISFTDQSDDLS